MFERWIEEHVAELKENVFILRSNYIASERQLISLIIKQAKLNWQYRQQEKKVNRRSFSSFKDDFKTFWNFFLTDGIWLVLWKCVLRYVLCSIDHEENI